MWKCERCNKENQDSIENCTGCGQGKTMDYIHHRTLSRIKLSTADNWKINNNSSSTTYDYSTDGEKTGKAVSPSPIREFTQKLYSKIQNSYPGKNFRNVN